MLGWAEHDCKHQGRWQLVLGWRPDHPCVALSGRGVALREDSGRIGELENGNRVLESIQHHINIYSPIYKV